MVEIFKFQIPLKKNVLGISQREIGILKYTDDRGKVGYGEVSPLPGFSNFEKALQWAEICAVEMINSDNQEISVKVNGLITDPENAVNESKVLNDNGYTHVKLKVGNNNSAWNLTEIINQTNLMLRLDGNSKLALEIAVRLVADIPKERIEYFEDPVPHEDLESFTAKTGIPYVIDGVGVIKPTMIGFIPQTAQVLSSSYESALGVAHLAHAVRRKNLENQIHGLDTLNVFVENIFEIKKEKNILRVPGLKDIKKKMDIFTRNLTPAMEY